jgi:hypothetical protein
MNLLLELGKEEKKEETRPERLMLNIFPFLPS